MTDLNLFFDMTSPHHIDMRFVILAFALLADSMIGDPNFIWRRIPHPVVIFGKMISISCQWGNKRCYSGHRRRINGIVGMAVLTILAALLGGAVMIAGQFALTPLWGLTTSIFIELIVLTTFLAGKNLAQHVNAVMYHLTKSDLAGARLAISMIVGRNTDALDGYDIARASIETTAENLSDGVIAPAFYYLLFGLPGLFIYKMVNTADSMIGYRSKVYAAFGTGAARFDDLLNLIPARLTGLLIVLAEPLKMKHSFKIMWRDAKKHRSPNAGWPEAAMAATLGLSLAGPRRYGQRISEDPALNPDGRREATATDILIAIKIMWRTIILMIGVMIALGFIGFFYL